MKAIRISWKPSDREVESIVNLNSNDRYRYFLKKVIDQEELWSIWREGWVLALDDKGARVNPYLAASKIRYAVR